MTKFARALVDDVRALIATFADSEAQSFEMTLSDGVTVALVRRTSSVGDGKLIMAPHVATILRLPEENTLVDVDGPSIVLGLLNEEIDIDLGKGVVDEVFVKVGDLVEFESPLLRIRVDSETAGLSF